MACAAPPGFEIYSALTLPTAELLTRGGDSRLLLDSATGLNRYGCSSSPRERASSLGSCTASSVSSVGYVSATQERRRLLAVGRGNPLREVVEERYASFRSELVHMLTSALAAELDIAFTPSGTDAELLAL